MSKQLYEMDMSELYREAMRHGHTKVTSMSIMGKLRFIATIEISISASELSTRNRSDSSPEEALIACIKEARTWPLEPAAPERMMIERAAA